MKTFDRVLDSIAARFDRVLHFVVERALDRFERVLDSVVDRAFDRLEKLGGEVLAEVKSAEKQAAPVPAPRTSTGSPTRYVKTGDDLEGVRYEQADPGGIGFGVGFPATQSMASRSREARQREKDAEEIRLLKKVVEGTL
jgi:hypothetical protein